MMPMKLRCRPRLRRCRLPAVCRLPGVRGAQREIGTQPQSDPGAKKRAHDRRHMSASTAAVPISIISYCTGISMKSSNHHPRLSRTGLAVLLAGQLLPIIDFSIVNVALASISQTLKVTQTSLEMVVAIYGVAFAVCLAMAGRLGDNFGRRRLFG